MLPRLAATTKPMLLAARFGQIMVAAAATESTGVINGDRSIAPITMAGESAAIPMEAITTDAAWSRTNRQRWGRRASPS
jgi:hypothetical protein